METRYLNVSKIILRCTVSETSKVLLIYRQSAMLCSYAHTYDLNVKLNGVSLITELNTMISAPTDSTRITPSKWKWYNHVEFYLYCRKGHTGWKNLLLCRHVFCVDLDFVIPEEKEAVSENKNPSAAGRYAVTNRRLIVLNFRGEQARIAVQTSQARQVLRWGD
jgi:hypothetical protein